MRKAIVLELLLLILVILLCLIFLFPEKIIHHTYYVDDAAGNDANSGTSPSTPWKSLSRINRQVFEPGDRILFKSGGVWTGELHPKGSGTRGHPIRIGRYGQGKRPLIHGGGGARAVFLYNQEYWDIGHLEITNQGPDEAAGPRRGVEIMADHQNAKRKSGPDGVSTLRDIRLHDLYIHDVNGQDKKDGYGSSGIHVWVSAGEGPHKRITTFDGILIENNVLENIKRTGIMTMSEWSNRPQHDGSGFDPAYPWTPLTGVVIRGNRLSNICGDGIVPHVTDGALVEHNKLKGFNRCSSGYNAGMWTYNGDNTVFQFNEVSGGHSTRDGMAFDFDHGSKGIIYQYNYSHDNEGGTLLICNNLPGGGVYDGVFRYNISQNDRNKIFTVCQGDNARNIQIYNNVFFVGEHLATLMLPAEGGKTSVILRNNIFYNLGSGGYAAKPGWTYENNVFYGNRIPDANTVPDDGMSTSDPMFVSPGSNPDGYKLRRGSPAIGGGMTVHGNGGRDFWGNSVHERFRPNQGAYNGDGEY